MTDDAETKLAAKLGDDNRAAHPEAGAGAGASAGADDAVPRLPRGRGIRLSGIQLVRIVGTAGVLVVLIVMQKPCSRAVSNFVTSFGNQGSGSAAAAGATIDGRGEGSGGGARAEAPGRVEDYERLRPDMTDDERRAAIERAKARAAAKRSAP